MALNIVSGCGETEGFAVADCATRDPAAARETFQGLRKLPPEKQHELRERWLERRAREAERGPPPPQPR